MKNSLTTPAPPPQQIALVGPVRDLADALLPILLAAMPVQEDRLLTTKEVAQVLQISVTKARQLINREVIPSTGRAFGDPRVLHSDLFAVARRVSLGEGVIG